MINAVIFTDRYTSQKQMLNSHQENFCTPALHSSLFCSTFSPQRINEK